MHTPGGSWNDTPLSEAEMRRVLARAGELDAANQFAVTEAELAQVADEAGISRAALQQALLELRQAPTTATQAAAPVVAAKPARSWRRYALSGAIGAFLGLCANALESSQPIQFEWGALIALGAVAGRSLQLAFSHRRGESKLEFQAELAALWAAFAGGYVITGGEAGAGALGPIIGYWVFSALIGTLITSVKSLIGKQSNRSE